MLKTMETFDTEFSADSVEWCPAKGFEDLMACGTYQLTAQNDIRYSNPDSKNKRIGRIYLLRSNVKEVHLGLKLLQKLDVAAVLDMRWAHIKNLDKTFLAVANAEGFLQIYELDKYSETISLRLISESLVGDPQNKNMALSLDWSIGTGEFDNSSNIKLTVSDSGGDISLFQLEEGAYELKKITSWHAHNFEAWIATFDYWNTNIIYTGKNHIFNTIIFIS